MKSSKMKRHGFTLIELLVVIAIIALLLAILMPSLQTVKTMAQGIVGISDTKTMSTGTAMFVQDHDDNVPNSIPTKKEDEKSDIKQNGWVTRPHDINGQTISPMSNATLEDRIRGVEGGTLYPYVNDHKVFHCKGDRRFKDTYNNYLSYSMPGCLRPDKGNDRAHYVNKFNQISLPSTKYIFLEESDPRAYFSGSWSFGVKEHGRDGWWDGLAIWHNNASTFGYADGHAENHKWRDDYTRTRAGWTLDDLQAKGGNYGYMPYAGNEAEYGHARNDLNWMQDAWPYSN